MLDQTKFRVNTHFQVLWPETISNRRKFNTIIGSHFLSYLHRKMAVTNLSEISAVQKQELVASLAALIHVLGGNLRENRAVIKFPAHLDLKVFAEVTGATALEILIGIAYNSSIHQ